MRVAVYILAIVIGCSSKQEPVTSTSDATVDARRDLQPMTCEEPWALDPACCGKYPAEGLACDPSIDTKCQVPCGPPPKAPSQTFGTVYECREGRWKGVETIFCDPPFPWSDAASD